MSGNHMQPETAERNATLGGRYTFNAFPDEDYVGPVLVLAALRLGEHAHVNVYDGHQRVNGNGRPQINYGQAGKPVMSWDAWRYWRDQLVVLPGARIAEVEKPTREQLDAHKCRG